jgi:hypothetical protein
MPVVVQTPEGVVQSVEKCSTAVKIYHLNRDFRKDCTLPQDFQEHFKTDAVALLTYRSLPEKGCPVCPEPAEGIGETNRTAPLQHGCYVAVDEVSRAGNRLQRLRMAVAVPKHHISVFELIQKIGNVLRAMLKIDIQGNDALISFPEGVLKTAHESRPVSPSSIVGQEPQPPRRLSGTSTYEIRTPVGGPIVHEEHIPPITC